MDLLKQKDANADCNKQGSPFTSAAQKLPKLSRSYVTVTGKLDITDLSSASKVFSVSE